MNENLMKQPLKVVPLSVQNKRIVIGFDGNIETLNTLLANAAHDDGVGSSIVKLSMRRTLIMTVVNIYFAGVPLRHFYVVKFYRQTVLLLESKYA
uniref:Uncharacterized protein n=1 Tax=Glossina palpalis gambiensis TaxID=67801 RepID=A0A1B0BWI3_9MUSC